MKILSIRGGGMKGKAPATILARLEQKIGKPCCEQFDMIVGTSTGGILAIGLGLGLPAVDLVKFYDEDGPVIFQRRLLHRFGLLKSQFDGEVLRNRLDARYQGSILAQWRTKIMVTASDVVNGHGRFIKSWQHGQVIAADAARATSAAPSYFDPAVLPKVGNFEGGTFCDGGLFANNPAPFALAEAFTMIQNGMYDITGLLAKAGGNGVKAAVAFGSIKILDLACPEAPVTAVMGDGLLKFLPQAASDVIEIGMDAASGLCERMMGANYLQVIPQLGAASSDMADASDQNRFELQKSGEQAWVENGEAITKFIS